MSGVSGWLLFLVCVSLSGSGQACLNRQHGDEFTDVIGAANIISALVIAILMVLS